MGGVGLTAERLSRTPPPGAPKPLVIGLTGGIGSGKSSVLRILESLGAEGIDADRVAHEVMAPGGLAYEPLRRAFGAGILAADGSIDRKQLGAMVFADPAQLARLEAIVHPAVAETIARRVAASQAPALAIEAIKLLEAGLSRQLCDQVWVTQARPEQQRARLTAGRGMSEDEIARRMAAQMPPEQMAAQADRVLDTSLTLAETGLQLLSAWTGLGLPDPTLRIRPATLDDAEGIAAVLNSIVREGGLTVIDRLTAPDEERAFLARFALRARGSLIVAELGSVIAGFQVAEPYAAYTGAMDHVASMGTFVAAAARGRGLGRRLAQASFAALRANAYAKVVVSVRADNAAAQAYYGNLGFAPCGRLHRQARLDGVCVDELLYELFLTQEEERSDTTP